MSHNRFYRPILLANIIGDKFSSRTVSKSADKIIIGFRFANIASFVILVVVKMTMLLLSACCTGGRSCAGSKGWVCGHWEAQGWDVVQRRICRGDETPSQVQGTSLYTVSQKSWDTHIVPHNSHRNQALWMKFCTINPVSYTHLTLPTKRIV